MVTVPSFILRRLYVKGSLRNTPQGFQFQLKNQLGSGYAKKLLPLTLDDKELPIEICSFIVDEKEHPFSAVSEENPFTLGLNRATTIQVKGISLSQEPHKIGMAFVVAGLGTLKFDFTDVPADG
jgi:hydroxymethylglutaryl-CoA reductase (NADPH)